MGTAWTQRGWPKTNTSASDDGSGVWLASTVWSLLEKKYSPGKVPSVRRLSRLIREANDGVTISHGHIHNILSGEASNITDRTRGILARFFGVPSTHFVPAVDTTSSAGSPSLEALAFRFAAMRPEELAAVEEALRMVREAGSRMPQGDAAGDTGDLNEEK